MKAKINILFNVKKLLLVVLLVLQSSFVVASSDTQLNVEMQLKKAIDDHLLHFPVLTQKIYLNRFNQSIWFNYELNNQLLKEATNLLNTSPAYGLSPLDYHCNQLSNNSINSTLQNNITDGLKPMLDILLTDAMLTFIAHLHYGKINANFPMVKLDQTQFNGLKIDSVLLSAINNSLNFKSEIVSVEPAYEGYKSLQQFTKVYAGQFDVNCSKINDQTYNLLALNLERWKWLTKDISNPYIFINIPAFNLTYFDQENTQDFKIIIGKSITKTPILTSKIRFFITAPSWVVPKSIMRKEIIPKALKNRSYLSKNHMVIYERKGNIIAPTFGNLLKVRSNLSDYSIIQSPGADNALGQIKFNFDNSFSVYLHDTPNRNLFDKSDRALSHGCIRVQNPEKLVELFLDNDKTTSLLPEVLIAMAEYKRKTVYLKNPIPILVFYFTAEIKNGSLITYKDLYNKDKSLIKSLKLNYL
jgi:murein L,D-transpeptidase YcbB/YkuD